MSEKMDGESKSALSDGKEPDPKGGRELRRSVATVAVSTREHTRDVGSSDGSFPLSQIVGLGVARCCARASLMIMMSCNMEMLIQHVFDGDALAAQALLSRIRAIDSFASFWIGPIKSSLAEWYGRKTAMVWPTLVMAAARTFFTWRPTKYSYILYRIVVTTCASFFAAYQAALVDLIDPTTDTYTATSQVLDQCATVTGMVTLLLVKYIRSPQRAMYLASAFYVSAAVTVQFTVTETLHLKDRVPVPWKQLLSNPLGPLSYFIRSKELFHFHLLTALWDTAEGAVVTVVGLFRRQVHGWGMAEVASHQFFQQVFEIFGSFGTLPLMRASGVRGSFFFGKAVSVLSVIANILVPSKFMFITAVLGALRYDYSGEMREGSYWRKEVGATVSEARAANMNLFRVIELFMPTVWTKLYMATAGTRPRFVFCISLVIQILLLGMTPMIWPDSEQHALKKKKQ